MAESGRSNTSMTELLRGAQHEKTIELLPLIIVMALLGVIGILGNVITIKFYTSKRRKTPTILLIISLAIVDLIVCVLFVPNIVEMCVNVIYTSPAACKVTHFIGHWFLESSGLILGFIALDRYRKICAASSRHKMTKTFTKRAVTVIVVFSCLMSGRDFANFDIATVSVDKARNSSSPVGHVCTTSKDPKLKLSVLIFHGIDALLVVATLAVIIFAYSNIIWKVCTLRDVNAIDPINVNRDIKTTGKHIRKDVDQSEQCIASRVQDTSASPCADIDDNGTIQRQKRKPKTKRKIRRSEWNVTMLMLAVSMGCILCVAPYFIIKLSLISVTRASDLELDLLTQFGLRLVYINSVLNPLIYCLFNPSFRRHVRRLLSCTDDVTESVYSVTSGALSDWSTAAPSEN